MYMFMYLNKTHKSKSSCIYIYMRVFIYQTCVLVINIYELPIMFQL